ncbi:MAG: biopolymer transporter ExbD [Kofleriaceae bacterium]|nr:MAG: biopolymer transporter ExbD [Kofleriaceae bacterium]MBZ0238169.1 biopolymer transporter ExbD [Kofleriaceae bacterium]
MAGRLPDDEEDGGHGGGGIFSEINITPLTDVFLVMVIIFMVSALAVQAEAQEEKKRTEEVIEEVEASKRSGLKVTLPSGAAQEIDVKKESLILLIPVEGDIMVSGRVIKDDELDNLFLAAFTKDKATQVVLQADKGVPHGRVVNVMERAKAAGLTRLAIGTSPAP